MFLTTSTATTSVRSSVYRSFCSSSRWLQEARDPGPVNRPARVNGCPFLVRCPPTEARPDDTFEQLGLHPRIWYALQRAFPTVTSPTKTQKEFIPAILKGSDVFLKDATGSGKSFGLLLALLSKQRRPPRDSMGLPITSLVVVPHRDLAHQFMHWIERIFKHLPEQDISLVAQALVRDPDISITDQLSRLRQVSPHILIGTATALDEALKEDESPLRLSTLSTVVVDEIDYLVETQGMYKDKYEALKIQRRIKRHPGPTRELLDRIYERPKDTGPRHRKPLPIQDTKQLMTYGMNRPQLVLSSATFRAHSGFLASAGAWLVGSRTSTVTVTGAKDISRDTIKNEAANTIGSKAVQHSVLVVSAEGVVTNIKGAVEVVSKANGAETSSQPGGDDSAISSSTNSDLTTLEPLDSGPIDEDVPLGFQHRLLEAVAEAFALDVPRVALLVLPGTAPVRRVVQQLRRLGVDAHDLDLVRSEGGGAFLMEGNATGDAENPTLLVCTMPMTRGLDFPELTHVFILGAPGEKETSGYADSYLHAAGRVGRFGRSGKVISVVEARYRGKGKKGIWVDEPVKLKRVLARIGVQAMKFEHFD